MDCRIFCPKCKGSGKLKKKQCLPCEGSGYAPEPLHPPPENIMVREGQEGRLVNRRKS